MSKVTGWERGDVHLGVGSPPHGSSWALSSLGTKFSQASFSSRSSSAGLTQEPMTAGEDFLL